MHPLMAGLLTILVAASLLGFAPQYADDLAQYELAPEWSKHANPTFPNYTDQNMPQQGAPVSRTAPIGLWAPRGYEANIDALPDRPVSIENRRHPTWKLGPYMAGRLAEQKHHLDRWAEEKRLLDLLASH